MQIQSITYSNSEGTVLSVVTTDGRISVPWPCRTWHREYVQEWLDKGGVIGDYVAPPIDTSPTLEERVAELETLVKGQQIPQRVTELEQKVGP